LSRAIQVAPTFANYNYRRGYALTRIADKGNPDAYEEAKEPLKKCIETDPNYAECYYWLGWTLLWTDDEQGALENFSKAIEHDPTGFPYFYPSLAETYIALQLYDEAEKVLKEGTRLITPKDEPAQNALYGMYTLLSTVYQVRGDETERVAVLEKANEVAGERHPEIAFNLGSTYAVMNPPKKERALQLLKSFTKRSCSGAGRKQFQALCEQSSDLVQRLSKQ
jgi:tetratricopeptide (TPR) repeat protein